MGFTCGLYKVKRFNNLDLNQINTIEKYYEYQENDWAKKNYTTWEEYCKAQIPESFSTVTQKDIDSYKDEYIYQDYHKSLSKEYDSWCSNGMTFHTWFTEKGKKISDYEFELDYSTVIAALNHCTTELQNMTFKPVIVRRAFTENEETEVITSIPCDGVEIEDSDGNIKREYTDDLEYTNLYTPENGYFNEDEYNAYIRLQNALICILVTTDFDNELVFYSGGW